MFTVTHLFVGEKKKLNCMCQPQVYSYEYRLNSRTGQYEQNQILRYRFCNNIVEMAVGAFTKYLHNEIFDK